MSEIARRFRHPEVERMVRVGGFVYAHRWAEGNAGNMSVRLTGRPRNLAFFRGGAEGQLPMAFPALAGEWFLVTATGRRMRDLARDPGAGLLLVEILRDGRRWRARWGLGTPTSEFACHLAVHDACVERHPESRAVLHVHSPHLIILSHLARMRRPGALRAALERVHPEAGVLLGLRGLNFVPFRVGGTPALARATGAAMRGAELAMWAMHGLVVRAADLETALDHAEMAERAAELYLWRLAADPKARGLTARQLAAVRAVFRPKALSKQMPVPPLLGI
ncbi:MAG: class II aldolase/adducin family protein [Planctomycetota bacterium]